MRKQITLVALLLTLVFFVSSVMQNNTFVRAEAAAAAEETQKIESEQKVSEAQILGEDTSKRTEDSKTFYMSDQTYMAVQYLEPVHYQKDGAWEDIDNTLSIDAKTGRYVNGAGKAKISFSATSKNNELGKLEYKGYQISWGLAGENVKGLKEEKQAAIKSPVAEVALTNNEKHTVLTKMTSEATYADVFEGADLQYVVTPTRVKENIILNEKQDGYVYDFSYDLDGLVAQKNDDGSISLCESTGGEMVLTMPAPFMTDAKDQYSDAVSMDIISQDKQECIIRMTADAKWVNASDRAWPVVIDPQLIYYEKSTTQADFVESWHPDNPTVEYSEFCVGYELSSYHACRAFMKMALPPSIGDSNIIVDSTITLLMKNYSHVNNATANIEISRVLEGWSCGTITWNNQPDADETIVSDYATVSAGSYFTWNVTELVKGWYDGTYANNGIRFKWDKESSGSSSNAVAARFYNSNYANYLYRPVFTVFYISKAGLEDNWVFQTQGINSYAGYVNSYTGNLVASYDLAQTAGSRMPVGINLVYNSVNKDTDVGFGKGWMLNISQTVREYAVGTEMRNNGYRYHYVDGDGTVIYFPTEATGVSYTYDELGKGLKMERFESLALYVITDKAGVKRSFNNHGKLVSIEDTSGNSMTIAYTATTPYLPVTITDGAGNQITLQYTGGLLTGVTDPANRVYTLGYFNTNYLRLVTDPDGTTGQFRYRYCGELDAFRDGQTAKSIVYGYSSTRGRVTSVIEYRDSNTTMSDTINAINNYTSCEGQRISLSYANNRTQVRTSGQDDVFNDSDDIYNYYVFDNAGNPTSVYSTSIDGKTLYGAGNYQYSDNSAESTKDDNKLKQSAVIGTNVENLLINGSAETSNTNWSTQIWGDQGVSWTPSFATNQKYIGNKCLRLDVTSGTASRVLYFQYLALQANKTYTFSAYVKTSGISGNYGANILVQAFKTGGTTVSFESEFINTSTDTSIENGWRRLEVTFTTPSDLLTTGNNVKFVCGLQYTTGTACFDCMQVEAGSAASAYNLLENAGLERVTSNRPDSWIASNLTTNDLPDTSSVNYVQGAKSFKMKGEAACQKRLTQYVYVGGSESDTYMFSGWSKANCIATLTNVRNWTLSATLYYTDGTYRYLPWGKFNPSCSEWQYASTVLSMDDGTTTTKTPNYIQVNICYYQNANYAFFDNFQLTKIDTAVYDYDADGNVIEASSSYEAGTSAGYDDKDQLAVTTSQTGEKSIALYDYYHQNRVLYSYGSGVSTHYTYDSFGNVTNTRQENTAPATGNTYYIATCNPNLVVDNYGGYDTENNVIQQHTFNATNAQKWYLEQQANGYYILRVGSSSTRVLQVSGNTDVAAVTIGTRVAGNANQEWSFTANTDGTYRLRPRCSTTRCLDNGGSTSGCVFILNTDHNENYQKFMLIPVGDSQTNTYTSGSVTFNTTGSFLTGTTDARGNSTAYSYDEDRGVLDSMTDANGTAYTYTYDDDTTTPQTEHDGPDDDILDSVSATNNGTVITNSYNYVTGYLDTITHNGFTYDFDYDGFGNNIAVKVAGQTLTENDYNDHNGKLNRTTYGNGAYVENVYDALDRVVGVKYNGVEKFKYIYNSSGQLTRTEDLINNVTTKFTYDKSGKAIRSFTTRTISGTVHKLAHENGYSYTGQLLRNTYILDGVSKTYVYTYNDKDLISDVSLPTGYNLNYTYDGLNRISQRKIENTADVSIATTSYTYLAGANGNTTSLLASMQYDSLVISYEYDALGNITQIKENNVEKVKYYYDSLSQLVREDSVYQNATITYAYDAGGNITERRQYALTGDADLIDDGTLEPLPSVVTGSWDYKDTGWKDQLLSFSGASSVSSISYDGVGNPQNWTNGRGLFWQNGRQLQSTSDGTTTTSYQYDDSGIRTQKTVNGVTTYYYYEGGLLLAQETNGVKIWFTYDAGGNLVGLQYDGRDYYYVRNGQGDITGILDSTGYQVVVYKYDSWGKLVTLDAIDSVGEANPFRYRGYYYDTDTGFYYLNSRYYDPEVCRFLNADGILGANGDMLAYNLYAYCSNNPVNMSDPSGYMGSDFCTWMGEQENIRSEQIIADENAAEVATEAIEALIIKNVNAAKVGASVSSKAGHSALLGYTAANLIIFYNDVKKGGSMDYKEQAQWEAALPGVPYMGTDVKAYTVFGYYLSASDIANLNFGAYGKAYGFSETLLLQQAGAAQLRDHDEHYGFFASQRESFKREFYGDEQDDYNMIRNGYALFQ